MAHFAELNDLNIVLRVLVIGNSCCIDKNGRESETVGAQYCHSLFGGRWVQTSYNSRMRQKYAGIGDRYDAALDVFISPQPYASWSLDDQYTWQPPVAYPSDNKAYVWNEQAQAWVLVR